MQLLSTLDGASALGRVSWACELAQRDLELATRAPTAAGEVDQRMVSSGQDGHVVLLDVRVASDQRQALDLSRAISMRSKGSR